MTAFWKRLFGGRTAAGAQDASDTETIVAASRAAESKRIEPISSSRFSDFARSGPVGGVGDTGPWFIGKTVAEIYQIRGVLGRGGMGIVYRAYDTATQRDVAIKVPSRFVDSEEYRRRYTTGETWGPVTRREEDARKRFIREAEIWSGLVHPHIVHVFDVRDDKTTDYRPVVIMDHCSGGSLADRLSRKTPLSLAESLDIAIQICWAMEFAQEQGLIHRDLKPGNVLLTEDGKALVSDFGLVKVLDLEESQVTRDSLPQPNEGIPASLTHGLAMGTPEYMPPEQWLGNTCRQSDIYALGVILYELFCGKRPFAAESRAALWTPHSEVTPPDPRQLSSQIPAVLADLMFLCLRKDPAARPSSFEAVADRLSESYQQLTCKAHHLRRARPLASEVCRGQRQSQAWALIRLGVGCRVRGDLDIAMHFFCGAHNVFREIGDTGGLSASLGNQALILRACRDLDGAMMLHTKEERICRETGNKLGLQASLGDQAQIIQLGGNLDGAMRLYEQQEQICRELVHNDGLSNSLGNKAVVLSILGDFDAAIELHKEEERICRELGNKDGLQRSLGNQALIHYDRRDLDRAMELFMEQEQICLEVGIKSGLSFSLGHQASILYDRRDLTRAMGLLLHENTICREIGDKIALHANLGSQALIFYDQGNLRGAIQLVCEQSLIQASAGSEEVVMEVDWVPILRQKRAQVCSKSAGKQELLGGLSGRTPLLYDREDLDDLTEVYEEQEKICRELKYRHDHSNRQRHWPGTQQSDEHLDGTLQLHEEQERTCRDLGKKDGSCICLGNQAFILYTRGDLEQALKLHKREEQICRELGNKDALQMSRAQQLLILYDRGDLDEALTLHKEEEQICRHARDWIGLSRNLGHQAFILFDCGHLDEAMELLKQQETICREAGNEDGLQRSLGNQALVLFARGDLAGAMRLHYEKGRICRELGNVKGLAISLINQASAFGVRMGMARKALRLAEEAHRWASSYGLSALAEAVKGILDQVQAAAQA